MSYLWNARFFDGVERATSGMNVHGEAVPASSSTCLPIRNSSRDADRDQSISSDTKKAAVKKKTARRAVLTDLLQDRSYFFLCVAQKADFPTAVFLHFVPCFVLPAHIAFFAVAMYTSFCRM